MLLDTPRQYVVLRQQQEDNELSVQTLAKVCTLAEAKAYLALYVKAAAGQRKFTLAKNGRSGKYTLADGSCHRVFIKRRKLHDVPQRADNLIFAGVERKPRQRATAPSPIRRTTTSYRDQPSGGKKAR